MIVPLAFLAADIPAVASSPSSAVIAQQIAPFVREAALRFGIPEAWIWAVVDVESRRNIRARSPKGAMGLMQIMPDTWQDLRARYGLGKNPFDARENILAGTAYLRELFDRYGAGGFLAAYNAGPGRYEDSIKSGRTLPIETQNYVAGLTKTLSLDSSLQMTLPAIRKAVPWSQAAIFVVVSNGAASPNSADFTTPSSPFFRLDSADEAPLLPGSGTSPLP